MTITEVYIEGAEIRRHLQRYVKAEIDDGSVSKNDERASEKFIIEKLTKKAPEIYQRLSVRHNRVLYIVELHYDNHVDYGSPYYLGTPYKIHREYS